MAKPRFLPPGWEVGPVPGIYHCVSNVVDGCEGMDHEARDRFVQLMRLCERFCGLQVLSYCVVRDRFSLLVEVSATPAESIGEREFIARLAALYSPEQVEEMQAALRQAKRTGSEEAVRELEERYLRRMSSLSQFMKTLKQHLTQWFNARHGRRGTLWQRRYKSVLVEDGFPARVLAAYVDLNPVREGMTKDPGDYRWCNYAEAVAGKAEARAGIARVMRENPGAVSGNWRKDIAEYRKLLSLEAGRRFPDRKKTPQRLKCGEKLGLGELLRHRVRHFEDGGAVGSLAFVEEVWERNRESFGPRRKSGARRIRGCEVPLYALRDLQVRAIE